MNAFLPLITHPPSPRRARVEMPRTSDPASGSVSPNAPSAVPSASGRSQRSRWSSVPNISRGRDPIVACACHAEATDWSAPPICSIAATKPTVDISMPPHFSGTSTPSSPSAPIAWSNSVGQRSSSHARAATGLISRSAKVAQRSREGALVVGEVEDHRGICRSRFSGALSAGPAPVRPRCCAGSRPSRPGS